MRRFVVSIELDNDAFLGDTGFEIGRILHELADRVARNTREACNLPTEANAMRVNDINGHGVCRAYRKGR